jgi:hypothetical protein
MLVIINAVVIAGRAWLTVECRHNATRHGIAWLVPGSIGGRMN